MYQSASHKLAPPHGHIVMRVYVCNAYSFVDEYEQRTAKLYERIWRKKTEPGLTQSKVLSRSLHRRCGKLSYLTLRISKFSRSICFLLECSTTWSSTVDAISCTAATANCTIATKKCTPATTVSNADRQSTTAASTPI
ncbi:unnamed protein product [Rotaria socialis]